MKKQLFAFLFIFTLLLPVAAFGQASVKISSSEKKMAAAITAEQLKQYLYFVASDAMGGRDTPSQGLDVTAEFLKMQLWKWGFKPAGNNGTFFQKIAIKNESLDPAKTKLSFGGRSYALNEDFYRISGNGTVSDKQVVFAGHGWMIKSKNIDAMQGVDIKDKVVVLYSDGFPNQNRLTSLPAGLTPADLTGTRGTDWADAVTNAKSKGAAGIILVASPQITTAWPQLANFLSRGNSYPEKLRENRSNSDNFPVFLASEKVGDAIFAGESGDKKAAAPFDIRKAVTMNAVSESEIKWTQNVAAIWEGSHPVLKNEFVAIGAHYDHDGVRANAPGEDKIWNGADDDGSGTVAVLAIAEALAKAKKRPDRSVLFVWHAGEEKGLWGSAYFNKFPTVDIKNIVAQLNIDMIGRSKSPDDSNPKNKELTGDHEVYVIGADMMSSALGAVTKATNNAYLKLDYNYKYDDPKDPNRFFYRSDHFNYAVNGIPIAFWFTGVHEDYHQASDHPDKIDYAKMEKITRTIFMTLWEVANLKDRPKVDKQLPPELTQ
ncbi:MAG: M20/M25/M40 family metallo-hydrolase, partial [Pyrinomonadaceae bacterium]